jgi:hypothetical protein
MQLTLEGTGNHVSICYNNDVIIVIALLTTLTTREYVLYHFDVNGKQIVVDGVDDV